MTKKKLAAALMVVALVASTISGCVSGKFAPIQWTKTRFCAIDFDAMADKLKTETAYVDGIYWHYVNLLKNGDGKALPIVVLMDQFLAIAKPALKGLQSAICPTPQVVDEAISKVAEIKALDGDK